MQSMDPAVVDDMMKNPMMRTLTNQMMSDPDAMQVRVVCLCPRWCEVCRIAWWISIHVFVRVYFERYACSSEYSDMDTDMMMECWNPILARFMNSLYVCWWRHVDVPCVGVGVGVGKGDQVRTIARFEYTRLCVRMCLRAWGNICSYFWSSLSPQELQSAMSGGKGMGEVMKSAKFQEMARNMMQDPEISKMMQVRSALLCITSCLCCEPVVQNRFFYLLFSFGNAVIRPREDTGKNSNHRTTFGVAFALPLHSTWSKEFFWSFLSQTLFSRTFVQELALVQELILLSSCQRTCLPRLMSHVLA